MFWDYTGHGSHNVHLFIFNTAVWDFADASVDTDRAPSAYLEYVLAVGIILVAT